MGGEMKATARSAEDSTVFRLLARGGYVATGVVHVTVGVMALAIAFTGKGDSDQTSALQALASAPLGALALWALAVLLWALGLFHLVLGITQSQGDRAKKWGRRLSELGQAVVFVAIGVIAASVALGNRSDGDRSAEEASRGLLDVPGGPILLAATGAGLAVGGIAFVVIGVRRGFRKRMRIPGGALGRAVTTLGVIGFAAKGAAIAVVGVLVCVAAFRDDPESAGALDTAIQTLRGLPGGALIAGVIGIGFIAYGVFCGFRSRYARL